MIEVKTYEENGKALFIVVDGNKTICQGLETVEAAIKEKEDYIREQKKQC